MTNRLRHDAIVRSLRRNGTTTIAELAAEIGASRRTVLRDIAALRDEGFVIHSEPGRGGGLQLDPQSVQTTARLTVTEIFALLISVASMRAAHNLPFGDLADAGLAKLEKALPPDKVRDLRAFLDCLYIGKLSPLVDISDMKAMEPDLLPAFETAFLDRQHLGFRYRDRAGAVTSRIVEPQAMLILPPLWYLVAWDPDRGDFRHFRMDRISAPQCLQGPAFRRRQVTFAADVTSIRNLPRGASGLRRPEFPATCGGMTEVTIDSLGQHGDGITEIGLDRVFVPFTLPGERVEIARDGERGTLLSIIEPSSDRAEPISPYFGSCGGCALQHLNRETYAAFKRDLVVTALAHAGVEAVVEPLVDATMPGRRRATMHVRKTGAGYMRAKSHEVLDIDACPILVPVLSKHAPRIARALHPLAGDADVSFTATDTGLDLSVKSERKLRPAQLAEFAQAHKLARLTFNGDSVYMARPPVVRMGKSTVELPPASFLQATEAAEATLARLVIEGVGRAKAVADLFSGVGPFALRLAETSRVYAADSDKPAIAALVKAVNHTQGLKPVEGKARDLFRDPLAPIELNPFDAVVFDPPRAGAEAQSKELARSKVKTVVVVSCEPKTFARDAAILIAGGYTLERVVPVDQFAYSTHVEVVGVFRR
jgi:23S rRNA (uracil1939-C5)-methyltransferase